MGIPYISGIMHNDTSTLLLINNKEITKFYYII